MMRRSAQSRRGKSGSTGFTLVELLVVIAIIAILASVVLLVINPVELTKKGRDAARVADLASLKTAIEVVVEEATSSGTPILCANTTAPCSGNSNDTGTNTKKVDGTGWVKVNFTTTKSLNSSVLQVDPLNDGTYHYAYSTNAAGDKWEIDATLESQQYQPKMSTDGGNNDNVYEVGSDLTVIN